MCIVIQSTCVEAAAVAAATLRTQRTHSDSNYTTVTTLLPGTVSRYLDFPWDLQRPPPVVSVVPGVMMNFYPFETGNRGSPGPGPRDTFIISFIYFGAGLQLSW